MRKKDFCSPGSGYFSLLVLAAWVLLLYKEILLKGKTLFQSDIVVLAAGSGFILECETVLYILYLRQCTSRNILKKQLCAQIVVIAYF